MGGRRCCCGTGSLACDPHCADGSGVENPTAIEITMAGYFVYPHWTTCHRPVGFGDRRTMAPPVGSETPWALNGAHRLPLRPAVGPGGSTVYLCASYWTYVGADAIDTLVTIPESSLSNSQTVNVYWYLFAQILSTAAPLQTILEARLLGFSTQIGDQLNTVPAPAHYGFGGTGAVSTCRRTFAASPGDPAGHQWRCAQGEEMGAWLPGTCGSPSPAPIPSGAASLGFSIGSAAGIAFGTPGFATFSGNPCGLASCDYLDTPRVGATSWPSVRFRLVA